MHQRDGRYRWPADFTGGTTRKVRAETAIDWSENTYQPNTLGTGDGASDVERNVIGLALRGTVGFVRQ